VKSKPRPCSVRIVGDDHVAYINGVTIGDVRFSEHYIEICGQSLSQATYGPVAAILDAPGAFAAEYAGMVDICREAMTDVPYMGAYPVYVRIARKSKSWHGLCS